MVIYIPIKKYKYMVITESDTILQEYYITRKYKVQYGKIYITKAERYSRAVRGPQEPNKRGTGRKSYGDVQASADSIRSSRKDSLRTLISKATNVRSLGSGHENSGLSDAIPRVHMMKPSGVHIRHTCTGKVYREYKHI